MSAEQSLFADLAGLGRLSCGNHYSHFYDGPEDLADAVIPFILEGLRNNEACLWVTSPPFERDQAIAALARLAPDLDRLMAHGQVEIIDHNSWYRSAGGFHAETVIANWRERERAALERGFAGLRISGNTFWLETPEQFRDFADYEAKLHLALQGRRITCLCSYCINKGTGKDILDVIRNHDFAMVRSRGHWEIIESASLKLAKNELNERLAQKERLLTEIHHRVKNNLQIVSSLLTLKSREFGPAAEQALDDTLSRISAMGLVHQMLYEQDWGGRINLPLYLDRLIEQLGLAYSCHGRISLAVDCTPGHTPLLDLDTAIPLGIAITEAITNAIKHAFPHGRRGAITVGVQGSQSDVVVEVRDDGQGTAFPGTRATPGAGLALIRGLAAQIGGQVTMTSDSGVCLTFTIPVK
jgi:two-component sensor histidine kinase